MPDSAKFYLTTPIYYVNARPHIGHTYTTVVADAIARRKRSIGIDTWFLTGTDEHGQKIERSARQAGCSPQEFADRVSAEFRGLWDRMGLTYDDFIRTTEPRHKQAVQKLFALLQKNGYIYKGSYTGQYCVYDELYVEAPPGAPCPDCGRPTETVSEENYFFKLSAFERKLLEFYDQNPEFIRPETRRNEVISFVKGGLRDLSVSRTSFNWGIPVAGDEKHVIYVWLDALANYITALGWGTEDTSKFDKFWPADIHIVGKEITRFHCVYWPAFLMAAGLPLPKSVVAHGWLLFEESKMSKSRGNIVRAETILEVLGADALRYFLLREIVFGQDGSFSFDALVQRYNADLANGYGNLVSRVLAMIVKYRNGVIPDRATSTQIVENRTGTILTSKERYFQDGVPGLVSGFAENFDDLNFSGALSRLWSFIADVDGFITAEAPWKVAVRNDGSARIQLDDVLYTAAEAIRIITALVYPVIPDATAKVWTQLGLGDITTADLRNLQWGGLKPGTKLGELAPLFPRKDKEAITRMSELEQRNTPPATDAASGESKNDEEHISKLHSLVDGLAVALAESTNETSTILALEGAIAETLRETIGGSEKHTTAPPNLAPGTPTPPPTAASTPAASSFSSSDAHRPGGPRMPAAPQTGTVVSPAGPAVPEGKISIDDFAKVELRVAQIKVAERVPKADKLLRLEVDLGTETRQVLAGIAESYAPESLIGRKIVVVANLAPRKLRGYESNGMVVAATTADGKAVLATFAEDIEVGARLK